jgi:hypothetical protein
MTTELSDIHDSDPITTFEPDDLLYSSRSGADAAIKGIDATNAWTLDADLDGSTMTGVFAMQGSVTSDGSKLTLAADVTGIGTVMSLDPILWIDGPIICECEFQLPTETPTDQDHLLQFGLGGTGGANQPQGAQVMIYTSGTNAAFHLSMLSDLSTSVYSDLVTMSLNTWHKLRLMHRDGCYTVWFDGVRIARGSAARPDDSTWVDGTAVFWHLGYSNIIHEDVHAYIRNIKVWRLATGEPA